MTIAIRPRAVRHLLGAATAAIAAATMLTATEAAAQNTPPTNLVSVCSGVSLPRSAVTGIMTPVINGIVTPLQNTINPIVGGLTGIVPGLTPLSINATTLLTNAAAGQPITLQVLNTNGVVVGPADPCNAQATSYTLANPAGLAIGGNQITGLGANGQQASAGTIDAVAIGNKATTDGMAGRAIALGAMANVGQGATDSIALGAGASATSANSVALGAGSVASRGVPEISVGAPGAERLITNVAAGTAATDAANTGQVATVAGNLATLAARSVVYDSGTLGTVTLGGANGTLLTNVAPGAVVAGSTDAVNGGQLAATNAIGASNSTAITILTTNVSNGAVGPVRYSNAGTPTTPNGGIPSNDVTLVGGGAGSVALHNVAAGSLAAGSTDAVNGGQVGAIAAQAANAVAYDLTAGGTRANTVTLAGGAAGTVGITNVAAGSLAAGSTDAVNGGQLATTNTRIDGLTTAVTGIGAQVATNTADITTLNGQVSTLNGQVAGNTAAIGTLNGQVASNTASIATIATQVAGNTTAIGGLGTQVATNTAAIGTLNGQVSANTAAINTLGTQVANGAIGPVQYSNPATPTVPNGGVPSNDLTLVGAAPGAVGLHNVAPGVVAAGSTDAVNGDQLATVRAAAANAVTYDVDANGARTNAVTLAGGAAGPVTLGNVAAGTIAAGSTQAVNGGQLAATNVAVTAAQDTASTALTTATAAQGTATTALTAAGAAQGTANTALATANTAQRTAATALTTANAAQGTAGTALAASGVAQTTANAAVALGQNSVQYDTGRTGVTLNPGGNAASIHNVAAGTAPTDAVNVSQLQSGMSGVLSQAQSYTDQRLAAVGFDLRNVRKDSFASNATALAAAGLPQSFSPGVGMISLGGGTYGGESAIAIGFSKVFNDGHTVVKFAGSRDSRGRTGASGGVGYQF